MAMLWDNWSKNVECEFDHIYEPASIEEIVDIVKSNSVPMPVLAAGHSWDPHRCVNQNAIDTRRLNRIDTSNRSSGSVTVLSGTRLGDLLQWLFHTKSETLDTFPFDADITVGGAIATASHGSSFRTGTISDLITELVVVNWQGEVQTLSASQGNQNEFLAWTSSVGKLGIVYSVTFATRAMPMVYESVSSISLDTLLDSTDWVKQALHCDRLLIQVDLQSEQVEIHQYFEQPYSSVKNNSTRQNRKQAQLKSRTLLDFFQGSSEPSESSYVEAEYCVPLQHLNRALFIVLHWIALQNPDLTSGLLLRFVGSSKPLLSPAASGTDINVYILVDVTLNSAHLLDNLQDQLVTQLQAKVHLGKYNTVDGDDQVMLQMFGKKWTIFKKAALA